MIITKVGLVRDHSGSMASLRTGAINDYNLTIEGIKNSVSGHGQEALVSVVECGVGFRGEIRVKERNENIQTIRPIQSYVTDGGSTPLFESVLKVVECLHEGSHPLSEISFLVMIITDGQNNRNNHLAATLAREIRRLQATDKWTFVFRVPKGYARNLESLGIPAGNIMEWEQTDSGIVQSTRATTKGVSSYFEARSRGVTSSSTFFTDLSKVSVSQVKKDLIDITDKVSITWVPDTWNGRMIRDFCEDSFGTYLVGNGYYQLSKPETVQQMKKIFIKHKKSGKTYGGPDARSLLGLPDTGDIRLRPKDHGDYEVFVQSTSVNRKLVGNTRLLYWRG